MSISISSSTSTSSVETYKKPSVQLSANELESLKKKPTTVETSGDIYTSTAIHFNELSLQELKNETIAVDVSEHTFVSHSDGRKNEPNRIVVMRDPENNNTYVTMELSKTSIDHLKQKFNGVNNFFERSDGALRLNGEAEAFVVGWMQNIRTDRNYTKADADGNGLIEGYEASSLTIGFKRQTNYDYIGKKVVKINLGIGANYQSLLMNEDEKEFEDKRDATFSQNAQFENSIEKELDHTLKMDADLNGTVTLDESLSEEFDPDYRKEVITNMEEFHEDLLKDYPRLNDDSKLQNHDFGGYDNSVYEEKEDALTINTFDLLMFDYQNDENISDIMEQLQRQTAKSIYSGEESDATNVQKTSE